MMINIITIRIIIIIITINIIIIIIIINSVVVVVVVVVVMFLSNIFHELATFSALCFLGMIGS